MTKPSLLVDKYYTYIFTRNHSYLVCFYQ